MVLLEGVKLCSFGVVTFHQWKSAVMLFCQHQSFLYATMHFEEMQLVIQCTQYSPPILLDPCCLCSFSWLSFLAQSQSHIDVSSLYFSTLYCVHDCAFRLWSIFWVVTPACYHHTWHRLRLLSATRAQLIGLSVMYCVNFASHSDHWRMPSPCQVKDELRFQVLYVRSLQRLV